MPVYKVTETAFEALDQTSFEREGILERQGTQARLRDHPEVLEEGLFILAEEFSSWDESSRRVDLLALDREGRLVIVELKRSDQDSFMDLQAVRYAAMIAGMTLEQAVGAHQNYLSQRGLDPADAASRIQQHLSGDETEAAIDSRNPRVILVSANFSKELTTSVLWLNEIGMAVTCVKLELYRAGNDLYLEGNRVIPLPEAEEYLVPDRGAKCGIGPAATNTAIADLPGGRGVPQGRGNGQARLQGTAAGFVRSGRVPRSGGSGLHLH